MLLGDGGDGGLGGVDVVMYLVSDHVWEVELIVVVRCVFECVGGWEYLVWWGGFDDMGERWEDSWEFEVKLELSDEMRVDLCAVQCMWRCAVIFCEWFDLCEVSGDW